MNIVFYILILMAAGILFISISEICKPLSKYINEIIKELKENVDNE